MRSILFLSLLVFLSACSSKNHEDISLIGVPRGFAYVQSTAVDDDIVKVLQYTGVQVLEDIEIKVHTDNTHYFYFAAVADYQKNENGGYSAGDGKLSAIKTFNGCFFYDLVKDDPEDYIVDQLSLELMVDKKINKVLGNDSLYLSINGFDYQTMPEPMQLSSYHNHAFNGKFYNLDEIVPLFNGNVRLTANKGKNIDSKFLVGMISYDCSKKYDFDEMFNSEAFLYAVGFKHAIQMKDVPDALKFDVNDFIVLED